MAGDAENREEVDSLDEASGCPQPGIKIRERRPGLCGSVS